MYSKSFSSSVSSRATPTTTTNNNKPITTSSSLTSTLSSLGFQPRYSNSNYNNVDHLYDIQQARPLLDAIIHNFSLSASNTLLVHDVVLTNDEADQYATLQSHHNPSLLPDQQAVSIVNQIYPKHITGEDDDQNDLIQALRNRLDCVTRQSDTLTQFLQDKEEEENDDDDDDDDDHEEEEDDDDDDDEEDENIDNYLDDVISLKEQLTDLLYSVKPKAKREDENSIMSQYIKNERQSINLIKSVIDQSVQTILNKVQASNDPERQEEMNVMIDSYARLRMKTMEQLVKLPSYELKLQHLNKKQQQQQSSSSSLSSMSLKSTLVKKEMLQMLQFTKQVIFNKSKQLLSNTLSSISANHLHVLQNQSISCLQICLHHLILSRLRLFAIRISQIRISSIRTHLFDCLNSMHSLSKSMSTSNDNHSVNRSQGQHQQLLLSSSSIDKTLQVDHHSFHLNDQQLYTFNELYESATDLLSQFRNAIGCEHGWLDLDLSPNTTGLIRQLEDEINSNAGLLKDLLKTRDQTLQSRPRSRSQP